MSSHLSVKVLLAIYSCLAVATVVAEPLYEKDPTYNVSLVQLIIDPEAFVGRKVKVIGYYERGINPKIFLNHLSAEAKDNASAIEVIDQSTAGEMSAACNEKYVAIVGRYIYHSHRHSLVEIESVRDAKSLEYCWTGVSDD